MLATRMSDAQVQRALCHGAWGVVAKGTACDVLPGCIIQVMTGQRRVGAGTVGPPAHSGPRAPGQLSKSLTAREAEIVERVATGASNREIAATLRMGEQTVKNRLRRIFKKLAVANRVGLALHAIEHGIAKQPRSLQQ